MASPEKPFYTPSMVGLVVVLALTPPPGPSDSLAHSSPPAPEAPVVQVYAPGRRELDLGRDLTWGGAVLVGAGALSAGFMGWGVGTHRSGVRGLKSRMCESGNTDPTCPLHQTNRTRGKRMVIGFGVTTGVLLAAGIGLLIAGRSLHKRGKQLERRAALSRTGIGLRF